MSDIVITITDAGRAALVNAANTGTAPVIVAACGVSATAVAPDVAADELPDEIKRIATLSGDVVADDTIHLIVRDESADVYAVRSLALYLDDGTLFAIYGQAGAIMEKSAQAMLLLTLDIRFADIAATALTFGDANFLNPPATTEGQGVVELATEAESATGTDAARAVTPKGLKAAVTGWLDARFGAGAPSAWVKSILGAANAAALRLALTLDKVNNTPDADKPVSTPQQTALDAKADKARTIVAGNGLIGGGTLEANRTVGMGTPATVTAATQNAVTATSHTHALNLAKGDLGLGNVDNTADAAKPVSTAQQAAMDKLLRRLNQVWNTDADGNPRFYFQGAANGGRTYIRYRSQLVLTPDDSRYPVAVDEDGNVTTGGSFRRSGNILWDAGNDGAGSGMDADLLRGLTPDQVVSLARVLAALGYTPLNKAGDGMMSSTEGAEIFYVTSPSGRIGLRPDGVNGSAIRVGGTGAKASILRILGAGDVEILKISSTALLIMGQAVWHSGNDGSGSGLDGDLWRGLDPAGFFAAYFPSGTTDGWKWRKWPDGQGGTMIRMARISDPFYTQAAYQTWTYPFALSELTECGATAELIENNISSDQAAQIFNPTTTQITINMQNMAGDTTWPIKARIVVEGRL